MKRTSILIVENDRFMKLTIAESFKSESIKVVATAENVQEAMAVDLKEIDVALLDLDLGPGANGIDLAHAYRSKKPTIGIVILTTYSDPRISDPRNRNLPKGTIFLTKSRIGDFAQLASAIISAGNLPLHAGRKYAPKINLTDREITILNNLASGKTTSQIAIENLLSEKTIEATITNLNKKMNISTSAGMNARVQLVLAFLKLRGKN